MSDMTLFFFFFSEMVLSLRIMCIRSNLLHTSLVINSNYIRVILNESNSKNRLPNPLIISSGYTVKAFLHYIFSAGGLRNTVMQCRGTLHPCNARSEPFISTIWTVTNTFGSNSALHPCSAPRTIGSPVWMMIIGK